MADEHRGPKGRRSVGWTLGEVAKGLSLDEIVAPRAPDPPSEGASSLVLRDATGSIRTVDVFLRRPTGDTRPEPTRAELPDVGPLADRVRAYVSEGRAEATRRAYAGAWRLFEGWCEGHSLPALPASPRTVAAYLAALADEGLELSTINKARSAIVVTHRLAGHDWPRSDPATAAVMRGIRRTLGVAPRKKAPILVADLEKMLAQADPDLRGLRDRAILLIGWAAALRRSELVALDAADLTFVPDGVAVLVRFSKTDQEGEGATYGVPYADDTAKCPVRALEAWMTGACITSGPVFRPLLPSGAVSEERLADRAVARIVQKLAARAGIDPARVAGHSLRAGFMTSAAAEGRGLDEIMRQSGHKSERVARGYIRHANVFVRNPVRGLL